MNTQLTNELLAFEADHVWVNENLETLLEQYAEQWIAVKDGKVMASDPDLEGSIPELPKVQTIDEYFTSDTLGETRFFSPSEQADHCFWGLLRCQKVSWQPQKPGF